MSGYAMGWLLVVVVCVGLLVIVCDGLDRP
jgi:hypothetical protein